MLRVAEITLPLAIEQRDPRLIGECALNLISMVYRERNDLDIAYMYLAQAVEQNVSLGDAWLQAAIVLEQAQIYRRRGFFKAAKQTFQHALDVFLKLDEVPDIANTLVLLGGITMAIATCDLGEAIDPHWQENPVWVEVEEYFRTPYRLLVLPHFACSLMRPSKPFGVRGGSHCGHTWNVY